jgi:hypothetical protein
MVKGVPNPTYEEHPFAVELVKKYIDQGKSSVLVSMLKPNADVGWHSVGFPPVTNVPVQPMFPFQLQVSTQQYSQFTSQHLNLLQASQASQLCYDTTGSEMQLPNNFI